MEEEPWALWLFRVMVAGGRPAARGAQWSSGTEVVSSPVVVSGS
jgi:hypothetical protein